LQGRLRQLRDIVNMLPAVKLWIENYEKEQQKETNKLKAKLKGA
jgi:hypothetical protein